MHRRIAGKNRRRKCDTSLKSVFANMCLRSLRLIWRPENVSEKRDFRAIFHGLSLIENKSVDEFLNNFDEH